MLLEQDGAVLPGGTARPAKLQDAVANSIQCVGSAQAHMSALLELERDAVPIWRHIPCSISFCHAVA